jgi:hypothetical protein
MEITKFTMFPGGVLVEYEDAVASSGANDQVLEGADSFKAGGWLRQFVDFAGGCGVSAGKDPMEAIAG